MSAGIYEIRNQVNSKRYIGSAVNLRKRWQEHLNGLRHRRHHSQYLQRAFDKYGESAFLFEVLEQTEPEALVAREQHFLDTLAPEYNIASTAGSQLGCRRSPESRRKMSERKKGGRLTEEHRRKIGEAQIGHQVTEATRRKLSLANTGYRHTEESKQKMREAWTPERRERFGASRSGERNPNYGRIRGKEERAKVSASLRIYWHEVRTNKRQRGG